jgi:hypothetical protein
MDGKNTKKEREKNDRIEAIKENTKTKKSKQRQ